MGFDTKFFTQKFLFTQIFFTKQFFYPIFLKQTNIIFYKFFGPKFCQAHFQLPVRLQFSSTEIRLIITVRPPTRARFKLASQAVNSSWKTEP